MKKENYFLSAFEGNNSRIPVWLMRQAGRYLPEYQMIKKKHTLVDMFRTPDIATEITLQPVDILGVDAAILFADILTLPSGMGFDIDFIKGKGPVIANPIRNMHDVTKLHNMDGIEYVATTISQIKECLSKEVPLIGFAGSPFTVLNYLLEHKRSLGPVPALKLFYENHDVFKAMMDKLTTNTIEYFSMQQNAGIDAFQLFDTWAGQLRAKDFEQCVLPYVQRIFNHVSVPSIYYVKNASHLVSLMDQSYADGLSVCETVVIGAHPDLNKTSKVVQGNFFNGLLYASEEVIKHELNILLSKAKKTHPKYIFNLSHGMMPDMNVEKVKFLVNCVQEYDWQHA